METVAVGLICAVVFGVVMSLSVFIRQLLLSRDKKLNDLAQQRALLQESRELAKLRKQMAKNNRFDSHYQVLGTSKESIKYIDQKIDAIFRKKSELIQRYAQMTLKESAAIIEGGQSEERKNLCDALKLEIDNEIQTYNNELEHLQKQRSNIWDAHRELLNSLISNEETRNVNLDKLYEGHSGMLEKIYLRHDQSAEHFAEATLTAGSQSFGDILKAPIQFLMQYFKVSSNISPNTVNDEVLSRKKVKKAEDDINEEQPPKKTSDEHEGASSSP